MAVIMSDLLEENGIQYSRSPLPGMTCFAYRWRHHPTRKKGDSEIWAANRLDFLELLNKWNHSDTWDYYA